MIDRPHPFSQAGLGEAPFRVVGFDKGRTSCDYCGTSIKNIYLILSTDHRQFKVGCDCVYKTGDFGLKSEIKAIRRRHKNDEMATKKAALSAEREERLEVERQSILDQNPGLQDALCVDHPIVRDIAVRFAKYRKITNRQIALVLRLAEESRRPPEKLVVAPVGTGRQTFLGVVVSAKAYDTPYGTAYKMTVKVPCGDGIWLAWGTVPAALLDSMPCGPNGRLDALRGATVKLTATLKPGKDAHFALTGRPVGVVVKHSEATQKLIST